MKIFMDFDDTIVNARKGYCDVYSQLYSACKDYSHPNWKKIDQWDLRQSCPLATTDIFEHDLFFYDLEFKQNAFEGLKSLSQDFEVIICTIGTYKNIAKKSKWIKNRLPFIKQSIFINNGNNHMNKSIINMNDSIFIDDVASNLISTNAKEKICYGEVFSWNEDWLGTRCENWLQLIDHIYEYNKKVK
jgi:5'(3')-deoxyribonucleotidase